MKTLFTSLCLLFSTLLFAQHTPYQQGQLNIQAGIGLFPVLNHTLKQIGLNGTTGTSYKNTLPPITLSADYGITDEISVGPYIGISKLHLRIVDYEEDDKVTMFGVRGLYHFDLTPQIDTYGGAMLGMLHLKATNNSTSENANQLGYAVVAGGRYYLQDNIAVYGEIGYGISILSFGLTLTL